MLYNDPDEGFDAQSTFITIGGERWQNKFFGSVKNVKFFYHSAINYL